MATNNEIRLDKEQRKKAAQEKKRRDKQLLAQRTRIMNAHLAYQRKNLKKIKRAPVGPYISLRNINKIYDNKVQAVFDFNLDIEQKEFIVFVGPSGCGKSTTLRMIAGLEDITSGDLFIDGVFANELHPKDRDIAMVFQSYALYPHMNVAGNMSFGLKIKKVPTLVVDENGLPVLGINKEVIKKLEKQLKNLREYLKDPEEGEDIEAIKRDILDLEEKIAYLKVTPVEIYKPAHLPKLEIRDRVLRAAEILQIGEYLDRKPKALSGGQCQRVALGRAIVKNAKVFLMDEPLSNLDAKLRAEMRSEIIKLHETLNATTIYVTHDQTEAMTMATRIVVMNKGYIQQIGTPIEVYNHPANMFVATFIGSPAMNLLNVQYKDGEVTFKEGLKIRLPESFKEAVANFYKNELANVERELKELESKFVEKLEIIERIKQIDLALEKNPNDNKLLGQKTHILEELRLCEESNSRRVYLVNALEKLQKINLDESIELVFGIRPEDIYQSNRILTDEQISDVFDLEVSVAELLGHEYYVHTKFEGSEITSKIHAKTLVHNGDVLSLVFDLSKVHLFDSITEKLIK